MPDVYWIDLDSKMFISYIHLLSRMHIHSKPAIPGQPFSGQLGLEVLVQRVHEAANAQQEDKGHGHRESNAIGECC